MPFIGNKPADSYLTLEKQVFTTSATDTYTLDREVSGVNDIELFLNNVRQEPTEAYTISGTTLTLASAITSSDSMYCIYQGRSVGTQAPATGSVTNAMLAGSIATSKLADGSTFATTNGITMADMWRLTTSFTDDASPISTNLERVDNGGFGQIGTGMTESSGIFTFPSTGVYYITFQATFSATTGDQSFNTASIQSTVNGGSTWVAATEPYQQIASSTGTYYSLCFSNTIFDCTNTSTHKVRFRVNAFNSNTTTEGDTNSSITCMTFIRLGDT